MQIENLKGMNIFIVLLNQNLKLKNLIQTDTFKNSYIFFCHAHNKYDFPQNLDKKMIIDLMIYWKSFVEEDKEIYDKTINLLKKENAYNTIKVGHKAGKNEDLNDIMTKVSYSNEALAENIKKNMKENGKYVGDVVLGADGPIDSTIAKIYGTGAISNPVKGRVYPKKINEGEKFE